MTRQKQKQQKSVNQSVNIKIGDEGEAITTLRPAGIASINDQRVDVVTNASWIEQGTKIKVIKSGGVIPKIIEFNKDDPMILKNYKDNIELIREKIDNQDINFYINFIVNSLFEANKYFNDQEPWNKKEDLLRLNTIVFTTLEIVRKVSFLLYPIIPESSVKALKIFGINEADINLSSIENNNFLSKVDKINKIDILFKKIEKKND